jgi:hypothetical protein
MESVSTGMAENLAIAQANIALIRKREAVK